MELPSHLRLPASPKVPMLPHVCLFQYVPSRSVPIAFSTRVMAELTGNITKVFSITRT